MTYTPDSQLDLRARHPDFQVFLDINEKESERVRNRYKCHLDEKYGEAPLQSMDVFPSNVPNSPIHIFIHGGYWRALDKASYSFVAEPFVKNNVTTCIVNYGLIPTVNMGGLLTDITSALRWIQYNASKYNGNPNQLIISGHSAGGHLALITYILNEDLRPSILGICSLSGIFDLSGIKNSYLNEVLHLNEEDVDSYSVSNKKLGVLKCPIYISVGSNETDFFIQQSKSLYQTLSRIASDVEFYEYPELNHYQIVHKLGREDIPVVNFILNKVLKTH